MKTVRNGVRPLALALMLGSTAMGAGLLIASPAHAQSARVVTFDIPAQSLGQALAAFSQQSGVDIVYGATVPNVRSPGVSGRLSPAEALSRLLTGSGLSFRFTGANSVTLEPAPATSGAVQLGPVRVEGESAGVRSFSYLPEPAGTAATGYVTETPSAIGPWEGRRLVDTPYSVTVVPAELIRNVQAVTVDQIYRISPTIQLRSPQLQLDSPSANMRGFLNVPPARNGLPGNEYAHGTTTEDVERIEILTGLSGFLYGPGNVGGIINYVSKRPTLDPFNEITLGYTGGSNFYAHADFGGPVDADGRLGYRINLVAQDGDTRIEDFPVRKYFVSGAFDWRPTDRLLLQVDGSYRDFRANRQAYWAVGAGIARPSAKDIDPTVLWSQKWSSNDVESTRFGANVRWDASDALTLRAGFLDRRDVREYIFPINTILANGTYNQLTYKTPPQDIRSRAWNAFADVRFATGGIEHKLTIGHIGTRATRYDHRDGEVSRPTLTGAPLTAPTYVAEPVWPSHGQLPRWNSRIFNQTNWMIGDDIRIGEQVSILAGLTHSTIRNRTRANPTAERRTAYKESAVTPTVSLIFKPAADLSLYATYMESLEQGGEAAPQFNGAPVTNANEILPPLRSDQIELGAKAQIGGALLTLALFQIDKGLQYYDVSDPARPTFVQDGRQVHRGVEATATGKLTDNLTVVGGLTLLDAKVKEQKQNPALVGKRPNNVSNTLLKLYTEYLVPGTSALTLNGGVNYVSGAWGDVLNTDRLPGYAIVDLGVRYETDVGQTPLAFRLNVQNVGDKRYWINSQYLGDARTVLFSASARF